MAEICRVSIVCRVTIDRNFAFCHNRTVHVVLLLSEHSRTYISNIFTQCESKMLTANYNVWLWSNHPAHLEIVDNYKWSTPHQNETVWCTFVIILCTRLFKNR